MIWRVGIFFLAFVPGLVYALDVNLYGLSYHSNRNEARDFNEVNRGIGVRQDFRSTKKGIIFAEAGVYNDSLDTWAKYGGIGYQFKIGETLRAGILLGIAHSPSYNDGEAFVAPVPVISLELDRVKIHTTFIPNQFSKGGGSVFAVYIGIPLKG